VRVWFGTLIAAAFALGSYVAFSDGPYLIDRLLHPRPPAPSPKQYVPATAPKAAVVTVDPPESQAVAPLKTGVIPGITLPPAAPPK
jgi:hypothetical protein